MDPATLSLLSNVAGNLPSISGLGRSVYGIAQLAGNKRPADYTYRAPAEVKEMLALARARQSKPLLGADKAREGIEQATASRISQFAKLGGSSGASYGMASKLLSEELGSLSELSLKEMEAQRVADAQLNEALSTSAQYRDREFDLNVRRPYEQALGEFFQRRSEGVTNLFGGLNAAGAGANEFMTNKLLMDELRS